jgi:hypothetical protein
MEIAIDNLPYRDNAGAMPCMRMFGEGVQVIETLQLFVLILKMRCPRLW